MTMNFQDNREDGNSTLKSIRQSESPFLDLAQSDHKAVHRLLKDLISCLNRYYTIEKASLALYCRENGNLRVTHMLTKGTFKSSLTLTIPNRHSLLYQVLMQGFPIVDNYPELITRNVIEKKILMGAATRSVAVIPLICNGVPEGLLSLASEDEAAFSLYLEGRGADMGAEFMIELDQILTSTAGIV